MIPEIITSYEDFQRASRSVAGLVSLFWIVEYSPQELGYQNIYDDGYTNSLSRFSLVRNECLEHPNNFFTRLNDHKYRIWTVAPYNYEW